MVFKRSPSRKRGKRENSFINRSDKPYSNRGDAKLDFKKIRDAVYELPKSGAMRVPVRLYASEVLLKKMQQDRTLGQARNVATLPGIIEASMVMPDGHEGFVFL